MSATYRIGIDIGGTFTDGVLVDEATGEMRIEKVRTTPDDFSRGFMDATTGLTAGDEAASDGLSYLIHATTVATNAVLSRRGARAALLATAGFSDVLEIARQVRHELYDLQTDKPAPLIPRARCYGVPERLDHEGNVVAPLDEDAVVRIAEGLAAEGVESIAICFLHAYRNPVHERRAAELVRRAAPDVALSVSSEIAPEIREYWRASTTATNAYIAPIVANYLERIEGQLEEAHLDAPLHIMQSSGGVTTIDDARRRPVQILESGPAAGVVAAAHFASLVGIGDALAFDMGGTTAKVGLIEGGRPAVLSEFEAGSAAGSGAHVAKASGYPILAPVVDLVEVGAGGGSIAWVDPGGLLRVGPHSAGADPGPACYDAGGEDPTVTDANLLLGRLNPDYFLGGQVRLRPDLAEGALRARCAEPLGLDVIDAALGVVDIADEAMVQAVRLMTVQRGRDPRELTLVATGGAGPLHVTRLATELGIPTVVVPPSPGVASAFGMLVTDLRRDHRLTRLQSLDAVDPGELAELFARLEATASSELERQGSATAATLERSVELRYVGQSWNLRVGVPPGPLDGAVLDRLRAGFDAEHQRHYGYCVSEEPVELVNVVLTATGAIVKPEPRRVLSGGPSAEHALKGTRPVRFARDEPPLACCVYDRYALLVGNRIAGPAIIEELDSATVVHPDWTADVADHGLLLLNRD